VSVEVRAVRTKAERAAFIDLPYALHRHLPHWIPPLRLERAELLDPKHNPFFEHGEVELLVAWRDGRPVGRITAHVDRLHLERHQDQTGFFGFFDAPDDAEVVQALVDACAAWHRPKGHTRLLGPYSFNINGEVGVLVDGFDTPPAILMTHNPPYYDARLTAAGFVKAKDLFAWRYLPGQLSAATRQLAEACRQAPGLTVRTVDPKRLEDEVRTVMMIFNEAWSGNWGYLPFTEHELTNLAKELKLVYDPHMIFIACVDGEPAAMSLCLPNVNEALVGLDGRLFPFGLLRLLWRTKVRRVSSARLLLLGIRPKFRGRSDLKFLSVLLYAETHNVGVARGYTGANEVGWTLEDNVKINHGIELMGAEKYKTYRVYEKALA
jgi:hypothetical protein